jgi:toxin secretion/phage lysis holin
MEKIITTIKMEFWKAIVAIIPAGYFVLTGAMKQAVFTMCMLLILDTITGWIKSTKWFCGGFSSTKMFNFKKMICYMIAILLAFNLSKLPYLTDSFIYVCAWLGLREGWSVMENLSDMGLPFPQAIIKKVAGQLKDCNK